MLIFIDDSGDPGFKLDAGSSRFFVIALIIFDDNLEAEKMAVAIKELKRSLGFPDKQEFKFNKSSKSIRESFLYTINDFDFRVKYLLVDKEIIYSHHLKQNKDSFYSYAIKMVLQHTKGTVDNARVRIDGSGDRNFRKSFLSYLRKGLNSGDRKIVKNCKLLDSKNDVLIQC